MHCTPKTRSRTTARVAESAADETLAAENLLERAEQQLLALMRGGGMGFPRHIADIGAERGTAWMATDVARYAAASWVRPSPSLPRPLTSGLRPHLAQHPHGLQPFPGPTPGRSPLPMPLLAKRARRPLGQIDPGQAPSEGAAAAVDGPPSAADDDYFDGMRARRNLTLRA